MFNIKHCAACGPNHGTVHWLLRSVKKQNLEADYALRGNRTPGGSMATTQVTTTPLMLKHMGLTYSNVRYNTLTHTKDLVRAPSCRVYELRPKVEVSLPLWPFGLDQV